MKKEFNKIVDLITEALQFSFEILTVVAITVTTVGWVAGLQFSSEILPDA